MSEHANPTESFVSPFLSRQNGELFFEKVSLQALSKQHGTPLYVYSAGQIRQAFFQYLEAVEGLNATVCYAVKANSNLSILKLLAGMGAGFDIVSAGELMRALEAGASPEKIVFSGVGKSEAEFELALDKGVGCFNVESAAELERLAMVAQRKEKVAHVSLRVNPDVDAKTHPYISTGLKENKFGVAMDHAVAVYLRAAVLPSIKIVGVDCHIGSQITEASPYFDALDRVLALVDELHHHGITIAHLDLGGGLGIRYNDETPPTPQEVIGTLAQRIRLWAEKHKRPMPKLMFEPGRSIVGNAGVLVTTVEYLKHNEDKSFAIVDAAMNDLMRPAMYESFHGMVKVSDQTSAKQVQNNYDIVGPVCETGDWLGKNRNMALAQGELIAILSAGAYGMSMASNYNTRPRAAEVLVDGENAKLIRRRETLDDLLGPERI